MEPVAFETIEVKTFLYIYFELDFMFIFSVFIFVYIVFSKVFLFSITFIKFRLI